MQNSIQEINSIKQVTDSLIQELWEASRDNDPTASFALPIEEPWVDPVEMVKKERFNAKEKSIIPKSTDALKSRLSSKPKIVVDNHHSILKSSSFKEKLKSLEENHQFQFKSKDEACMEILLKDDEYYRELQNFRKMHWNDLVVDELKKINNKVQEQTAVKRQAIANAETLQGDNDYVTSGFYRIDDRLFPTKTNQKHIINFGMGESDIPPVKVSIPFSKLSKTCRVYVPHTRLSYDPKDSVDIADYLFKGNLPHIGTRRKKQFKALASIKDSKIVKNKFLFGQKFPNLIFMNAALESSLANGYVPSMSRDKLTSSYKPRATDLEKQQGTNKITLNLDGLKETITGLESIKGGRRKSFVDFNTRRADVDLRNEPLPPITPLRQTNIIETQIDQKLSVNTESSVAELRNYQKNINHPILKLSVNDGMIFQEFENLCHELLSTLGDLEASLEDMTTWKDDFLTQSVPSNIKLQVAILFARMLRCKSDLHEPIFEIINQVKLYAKPWVEKRDVIMELEKEYHRHTAVLDVAIRKLELMQIQADNIKSQHRVSLWERLTARLFDYLPETENNQNDININRIGVNNLLMLPDMVKRDENQTNSKMDASDESSDDEDTGPSIMSVREFVEFKKLIRSYLIVDNPKIAKLKSAVRRLELLTRSLHPKYRDRMLPLYKRPLPEPLKPNYISFRMGTIINQRNKKFPISTSYSLLDLRRFADDKRSTEDYDSIIGSVGIEEIPAKFSEDYGVPLHKSNSYFTLHCLGRKAELRKPIFNKASSKDRHSQRRALGHRNKGEWNAFDSSSDESEEDHLSETDSDESFSLFEDLENLEPVDLQDAIKSFFAAHPEIQPPKIDEDGLNNHKLTQKLDAKKDAFSLQEVIELTLLHAQQVHVLQKFYENKLTENDQEKMEMEAKHARELNQLQNQINNQSKMAKDGDRPVLINRRLSSAMGHSNSNTPATSETGVMSKEMSKQASKKSSPVTELSDIDDIIQDSITIDDDPGTVLVKTVQDPILEETQEKEKKPKTKRKKVPRPPPTMPHIGKDAIKKSFLERLRDFTEKALERREHRKKSQLESEMAANEEKLKYAGLVKDNDDIDEAAVLEAEFMPMPGSIKYKDSWISKGLIPPWGGRFKISPTLETKVHKFLFNEKKINILNLFDVSIAIEKKNSDNK